MTSEERREIAARLRKLAHDNQGVLGAVRMRHVIDEGTRILGTVGLPDCAHVLERYADLIDQTCYVVGTTSEEGLYGPTIFHHELSCGHTNDTGWQEPPAFCQDCGARVVTDDD